MGLTADVEFYLKTLSAPAHLQIGISAMLSTLVMVNAHGRAHVSESMAALMNCSTNKICSPLCFGCFRTPVSTYYPCQTGDGVRKDVNICSNLKHACLPVLLVSDMIDVSGFVVTSLS